MRPKIPASSNYSINFFKLLFGKFNSGGVTSDQNTELFFQFRTVLFHYCFNPKFSISGVSFEFYLLFNFSILSFSLLFHFQFIQSMFMLFLYFFVLQHLQFRPQLFLLNLVFLFRFYQLNLLLLLKFSNLKFCLIGLFGGA